MRGYWPFAESRGREPARLSAGARPEPRSVCRGLGRASHVHRGDRAGRTQPVPAIDRAVRGAASGCAVGASGGTPDGPVVTEVGAEPPTMLPDTFGLEQGRVDLTGGARAAERARGAGQFAELCQDRRPEKL